MSEDGYRKSFSTGLMSPKESKKDTLWNFIEPGDPFDIRKFMIFDDLDRWWLDFQVPTKIPWIITLKWFVCSKLQRSRDWSTTLTTSSTSNDEMMQGRKISIERI